MELQQEKNKLQRQVSGKELTGNDILLISPWQSMNHTAPAVKRKVIFKSNISWLELIIICVRQRQYLTAFLSKL
jgi:hypothetical protein